MREVGAPASKSLSHRYLIAAALARGESELANVLESDDTARTREILSLAGAGFEPLGPGRWRVRGVAGELRGGATEPLSCDVRESGTTCRLLAAVLASGRGSFRIHGAPRMRERPIGALGEALRALGCEVAYEGRDGYPPLVLRTRGITAGGLGPLEHRARHALTVSMEESSQYFSGLLLASPQSDGLFTILLGGTRVVSWPYIGLTLQCMAAFGVKFLVETGRGSPDAPEWEAADWRELTGAEPGALRVKVQPGPYRPGTFRVEGDWSGASYLVAAGVLGRGETRVDGVSAGSLQGDRAVVGILRRMGASIGEGAGSVTVSPAPLRGVEADMSQCPDLVPTVAAVAAFAEGTTVISNVAHLRIKESDRIHAPAESLRRIGVDVEEMDDGLKIRGLGGAARVRLAGTRLETNNDHRMAMAQALYALRSEDVLPSEAASLMDAPGVVSKSFPDFWERFKVFDDAR